MSDDDKKRLEYLAKETVALLCKIKKYKICSFCGFEGGNGDDSTYPSKRWYTDVTRHGKPLCVCNFCKTSLHRAMFSSLAMSSEQQKMYLDHHSRNLDFFPEHLFSGWLAKKLLKRSSLCLVRN